MRKLVIAVPCVVDGSWLSSLPYTTSRTCICQLVWLTYRFKFINSLIQDAWVWSYKQTDPSWPPIFRTIWQQQRDHSFRYSLCLLSGAIMALRRNVLEGQCFVWVIYVDTHCGVSDCSDNGSLDSDSDVHTTSSHKQLGSSTGPLTPQFPHPFLKTIFITVWD